MNRIYNTIWNKATGTFVAVFELVNNSGGSGQASVTRGAAASFRGFCVKALSAALLFAVGNITLDSVAYAAPIGGTVTNGTAHISSGGNTTTINQTSQNTTINWQNFGINKGETVNFAQPNSNSVALNRVLGNSASNIYGTLNANGKVFLINPNGILFGSGASVNVGGLVASTLNMSDADFMAGKYHFTGTSLASVQNQGSINANGGYVAMLGANVSNQGTITAKMGTVVLVGGQGITLDVAGDGLLNVAVNQGAVNALVQNGGLIQADGGQVVMTAQAAGQLLNTVVNNTGVIEVQTLNGNTGSIKLLGDMNSGTVNVGGTLDASAHNGGNGGAIETSAAHVKVANDAAVTTKAANGLNGSWLIDPTDFTIAAIGGDLTGAALSTSLGSGNVTILTGTGGTGASGTNGDIFVNDAVSWSANSTLTLNAYRNININSSITSSGATGKLALLYGQGAVALNNTAVYNVNAQLNLAAGANFSTTLGSGGALNNYTVITALGATGSTTGTDLQGMGGNLARNYALGANIDATSTSTWNSNAGFAPVGSSATNFTGTFDGLGHTIANLTINLPAVSVVGLFGWTSSTVVIRNVGLTGGSVTGYMNCGALTGFSYGAISNSYATGNVSSTGGGRVGGLVGVNNNTINNSYATGNVSSTGGTDVGGLAGANSAGSITNSYATGAVSGTGSYVGGLVGANFVPINNSYSTGTVAGSTVGGLVGSNFGTVANSSWNTTTSGQATSQGGTGLTTAQLEAALPAGFSSAVWGNAGNQSTPYLLNNAGPVYINTDAGNTLYRIVLNVTQLQSMNNNLAGNYALGANIDAASTSTWNSTAGFTPVGNFTQNFTGTLDGLGHTISNLTINLPTTSYVGLFSYTSSTSAIRNVGLVGGSVKGNSYVGGLVGQNYGTISNSYATGAVSGSGSVGGLVGYNVGTISNSYWDITTSGQASSAGSSSSSGLTTTKMQSQSNFAGFDFTTTPVWGFGAKTVNNNMPVLCVFGGCAAYVKANAGSSVYGNGGSPLVFTNSLVNGAGNAITITPTLAGTASYSGAPTATSNASSYSFSYLSGLSLTGSGASSYTLAPYATTTSWTVNKLALTGASIAGVTTAYGTSPAAGAVSFTNVVGSDVVTDTASINSIAANNSTSGHLDAGSYTQTAGTTLSGASAANYTFAGVTSSANYVVNKLAITVAATGANKVYDATTTDAATLASAGVIGADTVNFAGTSATFANKNVGTGLAVSVAGITASGTDAGNYTLSNTSASTTANISPKSLTVTANNAAKTYGAANPTLGVSYSGFVNGETSSSLTIAPTVTTPATASSSVGSYATTASGAVDANYVFTYVNGVLTVNAVSQPLPLASVYSPTITILADGATTVRDDVTPETSTSIGSSGGIKLFTDQPGAFDELNLQIINHGIKLPKAWIISQVLDNAQ